MDNPAPIPPSPASKLPTILLVVSVLGLFATTLLLAFQNSQLLSQISSLESKIKVKISTSPSPTPSPTPTINWSTYKDDDYGYEVKGTMSTKQFLDNDPSKGYRLLLLRNTLKKQYFGINIKKVSSKMSLVDYWKTQSDMAKIITKFDQKTGVVGGKEAMFFTVQSPIEYQTTVVLRLSSSYMMEIKKTDESLADEILSTLKFTDQKSKFCGGIAGIACPNGFTCKLDGTYPDAGGVCEAIR